MTIDYSRLDDDLIAEMKKVEDRWFTSGLTRFSMGSGYEVDLNEGAVNFGLLLGPSRSIGGVLHDMGHFVTAPEHRIARSSFGLGGGLPAFSLGRVFYEHASLVSFTNELEAMVFGRVLQEAIGAPVETYESIVSSLRYMPGFYNVPGESDKDRIAWLAAELEKRSVGKTIEEFERLWAERVALLPAMMANERAHELFHDEAVQQNVEFYPMGEGCKLVILRLSTPNREAFSVMSDLYDSQEFHGEYPTLERARTRVEKILEYNGWEPDRQMPANAFSPAMG